MAKKRHRHYIRDVQNNFELKKKNMKKNCLYVQMNDYRWYY